MIKIISILLICFCLTGCSALKIISAPFKPTVSSVPKQIEKNKQILKCKGEISINEDGTLSCTEGFYSNGKMYSEKQRKLTFREKVGQFISKGAGYLVWGAILACVLTFTGFGWIVSGFFNILFGTGKVLRQVIKGIQRSRKEKVDLNIALESSTDEATKKEIQKIKQSNNIK